MPLSIELVSPTASHEDLHEGPLARKQPSLADQVDRPTLNKLVVIFIGLAFAIFLAFYDQASVAIAYTSIGADLNAGSQISWTGTAYLIANNASQLIYSRLSDIFGRKACLLVAIIILGVGDLACGFAKTGIELYIFRGIAGIGSGGITNLSMVIMADVTSLRTRGKWQGFIAGAAALGQAAGPFVAAVIVERSTWRWLFWSMSPLAALCFAVVWWFVPLKPVTGNFRSKLKKIDWLGCILSLAANILLLVGVSSGGSLYSWSSPIVLTLIIVGLFLFGLFMLVEWKVALLPVFPSRLMTYRSPALIFSSTVLVGYVMYANLYFLPRYLEVSRGFSPILSASFLLSLLLSQVAFSMINGQICMYIGSVKPLICVGFAIWLIGSGLQTTFDLYTSKSALAGLLFLQGAGVGAVIQTTLISAQAGAPPQDRSVVTGVRNFTRTLGGSFGIAVSTAILQNTLASNLPTTLTESQRSAIIHDATFNSIASLDRATQLLVRNAYSQAMKWVFVSFTPCVALCFVSSLFLKKDKLYDAAEKQTREKETKLQACTDANWIKKETVIPSDELSR